jgi:hypothetical protein
MSTPSLEVLVPPPAAPTAADGDFANVEQELGTALPADWKHLVRTYGYGTFGEFLHLWSPFFTPCPMAVQARGTLDADRELTMAAPGEAVPFPLYPDAEGALPWANTDNGDVVYWLTRRAPDAWPVAIWNARGGPEYDNVDGGAAALLLRWMAGEQFSRLLRPDPPRCFDPWRERTHFTVHLSGEARPFAERLASLIAALAPVELRGASGPADGDRRQVHLVCEGGAWRFTYDTTYGHNLRVAVPPGDVAAMQARVRKATVAMGCTIRRGL